MATIRLGTRKSPLALWQAEHVSALLRSSEPGLVVEIVKMSTQGDRILDVPLGRIGGKGLFVKEIEEALLRREIDLAVHSLKDVPAQLPDGLMLSAYPQRADPRDAWVSPLPSIDALPKNARVGTSSLRRQCQIKAKRSDVEIVPIRGSVQTRLDKITTENLSAVVLAAAGLERLGLGDRIKRKLEPEEMLPAVGQGILAIEIRSDDESTAARMKKLDHEQSRGAAIAERSMLAALGGGCQVPVAGHAIIQNGQWWLRGMVAQPDGTKMIVAEARANASTEKELMTLGRSVADGLLEKGAGDVLRALGVEPQGPQQ